MRETIAVTAPISAVTVLRDGARLVRRGHATVPGGGTVLALEGLPASLDPASVRIAVEGGGVALLEVEVEQGFAAEPQLAEVAALAREVERCQELLQEVADEDTAIGTRLSYLEHLSEQAARSLANAVGFGRRQPADLLQMADQLAGGTADALAARRQLTRRRTEAERNLDAATKRLDSAAHDPRQAERVSTVRATVESESEVEAALELIYHVTGASWRPLYDLRLEDERVAVSYLAEVTQRSGEDWPAVELTLSTTRRGRHSGLPELDPWYVGKVDPRPVFARARSVSGPANGDAGAEHAFAPQAPAPVGAVPSPLGAAPAAAPAFIASEVVESGSALAYRVPRPLEIPSDGRPHKVTVDRFTLDAALDHLTVPKLAPEAYLRATVTNTSPLLLLAGPANVFHGAEFVGATSIDTIAPGEELEVQLGVDDRMKVERELRRRASAKALLGSTRSVEISYEITVENHTGRPSTVTVQDNIPLSRDAEVKVRLREVAPKPVEQDDLGELTWKLELGADETSVVRLSFVVEHPAAIRLYGL